MKKDVSMLRNFKQILEKARGKGRKRLAVPAPRSRRVYQLLEEAEKAGLITPVISSEDRSDQMLTRDILDGAIAMAKAGDADMVFQGDAAIGDFIDALSAKDAGVTQREALSYISLFELPSEDRLIMLTDTMVQDFPNLRQKKTILENAIGFAGTLGIEMPRIAALSVAELINFSVPSSVDAAVLARMSERKQFKGIIDGPIDIDCSSSREKARRKGLESAVAGQVDIYFIPNIEAAYSIAEVLTFLGGSTPAGVLMGTRFPVVLNLRFESPYSLLLNIAIASIRS